MALAVTYENRGEGSRKGKGRKKVILHKKQMNLGGVLVKRLRFYLLSVLLECGD